MKIAQVPPLMESVPPKLYGGTERIVSYLTEELVSQGHDVTLFSSGDSKTSAELVACAPEALRLSRVRDPAPYNVLQLEKLYQRADEFDILHFHTDHLHFPFARRLPARSVTTMHGRLDLPDLRPLFEEFKECPLVSISAHQRRPLAANWVATVHHGLPSDLYSFREGDGGYLAFLGRISPEKGPVRAIAIAERAGLPLRIAAKIDKADEAYFKQAVRPLLRRPHVEFIGEIGEAAKQDFLGRAKALLFPVDWPEPFGLVMIEAMACGTPVIGWPCGAVPEILEDGVNGFIVGSVEEAVEAVSKIGALDRRGVRRRFDSRFAAAHMASNYLRVYQSLLAGAPSDPRRRAKSPAIAPVEPWLMRI